MGLVLLKFSKLHWAFLSFAKFTAFPSKSIKRRRSSAAEASNATYNIISGFIERVWQVLERAAHFGIFALLEHELTIVISPEDGHLLVGLNVSQRLKRRKVVHYLLELVRLLNIEWIFEFGGSLHASGSYNGDECSLYHGYRCQRV